MAEKHRPATTARLRERYLRPNGLPTIWCPGCGIGTAVGAMLRAIDRLELPQDDVVIATGIGCSGFIYNYLSFDGYHGTHGRALAAATGIKLANPKLKVIVPMGDGDCAAIGGNHFIHAARRNVDLTAIVVNNSIYGMTGGQYSPLTPRASLATTAPYGHLERPFDLGELARASGAGYVARGTTYHVRQLIDLIAEAISYPGFAVVEIISQCPIHYGRRNHLGTAAEMLEWMHRNSVPARAVATGRAVAGDRLVIGQLHRQDPPPPEYTALYEEMARRAAAGGSRGGPAGHAAGEPGAEAPTSNQDAFPGEGEPGVQAPTTNRGARLFVVGASAPDSRPASGALLDPPVRRPRWEVMLAGIGGQGLALAGVILADAAGIQEGRHVAQTETHSTNVRGGPSRSEVVVAEEEIDYPAVDRLDVLLALTARDLKLYVPRLRPDGLLVVDAEQAGAVPATAARVVALPLVEIARRQLGNEVVAGIVGLAAIVSLTGIVSWDALERAMLAYVPPQAAELNRQALALGRQASASIDRIVETSP
ncbi:MAG: 2-oxoacid:acceptor oxidoreductase family protein [Chloroflexi bacterium]|nr:2-oxoacid:acceptor oxidoreductase family protein [Chloroflexota bacterium]